MSIQTTTNYSQFKTIDGNRSINRSHVAKLVESLKESNLLDTHPIVVNDKGEIIDGQHRLMAAQELGIPVHYIVKEGLSLKEVLLSNSKVRAWSANDYLESCIDLGLTDYQILKDFAHNYKLPLTVSMVLLTENFHKGSKLVEDFRSGNFKIVSINKAKEWAEFLVGLQPYADKGVCTDREFIRALNNVFKKVTPKKFLKRVQSYPGKILRRANVTDYLRQLEDVYNYRLVNKVRFF